MLERVCSTVEPAAHFFLRNTEQPLRSTRTLDRYFFRNGGDSLAISPWWPGYLESVRKVPQSSFNPPRHDTIRPRNTVGVAYSQEASNSTSRDGRGSRVQARSLQFRAESRGFGRTTNRRQQASAALSSDVQLADEDDISKLTRSAHASRALQLDSIAFSRRTKQSRNEQDIISNEQSTQHILPLSTLSATEYERVWKSFVRMDDQSSVAADVFAMLASSDSKTDFERAVKVFPIIPQHLRSLQMYQRALDLQFKLFQHREAINLTIEADQKGHGLAPKTMAYFVKNLLWSRAAELWQRCTQDVYSGIHYSSDLRHKYLDAIRNACGSMVDLPAKVVALGQRLEEADPVYAEQRNTLLELYYQLALSVTTSSMIMRSITSKGILSVIELSDRTITLPLRSIALKTLCENRHSRTGGGPRSQLALLLYRNWMFALPNQPPDLDSLEHLAKVCVAAGESVEVYDYIFEQWQNLNDQHSPVIYETIIPAAARHGDVGAVKRYLESYIRNIKEPKLRVVSSLVYVYARIGNAEEAQNQFDRLRSGFKLTPDVATWNNLMLAYLRSKQPGKAFEVYQNMKIHNIKPNKSTFGILINLHGSSGDMKSALNVMTEAQKSGVNPTPAMFESLAESFLARGDIEQAQNWVEMETKTFSQEQVTRGWNVLLRHFAHLGDSEAILRIQKRMNQLRVEPDAMTYAALMTALTAIGQTQEAAKILRTLHLSQRLYANEFHYSILLHGFVKEGNRDMATVIYHEMKLRFPRTSGSAETAYLQMLGDRDAEAVREERTTFPYLNSPREHAVAHLKKLKKEMSNGALAYTTPQPGLGRDTGPSDTLSRYFEVVIRSMLKDGLKDEAGGLIHEFEETINHFVNSSDRSEVISIRTLTLKMELATQHQEWNTVTGLWNQVLQMGKKLFERVNHSLPQGSEQQSSVKAILASSGANQLRKPATILEHLPETASGFSSMIPSKEKFKHTFQHRFTLARALSLYFEALHATDKHQTIVDWASYKMPKAGFELNAHNWNSYIQCLSRAASFKYRLRAFHFFEKKMLPFVPSWRHFRRGRVVDHTRGATTDVVDSEHQDGSSVATRKHVSHLHPEWAIPTYFTVISLAAALAREYRLAREAGTYRNLDILYADTGRTVKYLQTTPTLRDRVQGLLLRGRKITGDFDKRARSESSYRMKVMYPGGVLGSESPYDNAPPEYADEIKAALTPENDIRGMLRGYADRRLRKSIKHSTRDLRLGEKLLGPVTRSPLVLPRKSRLETLKESRLREKIEIKRRIDLIRTIRRDARRKHFFGDKYGGVPAFPFQPTAVRTSPELDLQHVQKENTTAKEVSNLRPRATANPPPEWRVDRSSLRNVNLLTQRINPRMASQDRYTVVRAVSNRRKRAFTRHQAKSDSQKQMKLRSNIGLRSREKKT